MLVKRHANSLYNCPNSELFNNLVFVMGVEPMTSSFGGKHSIQLSYTNIILLYSIISNFTIHIFFNIQHIRNQIIALLKKKNTYISISKLLNWFNFIHLLMYQYQCASVFLNCHKFNIYRLRV